MSEDDDHRREQHRLRARIAEIPAEQQSAFLASLLHALPAVVFGFDADWRITFMSRVFPGLREEDVLGTPALDFIPEEDRERAHAIIERALSTGQPGGYVTTGPGPHGEKRRYRVSVAPLREADGRMGGVFSALDVTDVLHSERALLESERKLRVALASTRLGLWSWDVATGEVLWDERMRQAMGRPRALTLPEYIDEAVHPDDRDGVRAVGERAMANGRFDAVPHRIVRPDGEIRWMLTIGEIEPDPEGRPRHITGGNLDITEQRLLEEQLRHAQKLESVGMLTAGVAHNFNNMLMAVQPSLELLRKVVPAPHLEILDDALGATERAADMIRKLMTFAGQRRSEKRAACDVAALAARITAMCERTFDRHIALTCRSTASDARVHAVATDLEQVLMNLLVNARDAVLESGRASARIEVLISREDEDRRLPGAGPLVILRVRDDGVGMSDLAKKHAFEPFFTSKDVGRGTGLGLATSYALVRDLGGCIDIESVRGAGTTVTVILPGHVAADDNVSLDEATPAQHARSVLIIDDEPLIRRAIALALGDHGYRVRTAADGPSAFAELARESVDVVLLDRSMPAGPGATLLPELRRLAPNAKVAYFTGQDVAPAERAAVDAIVLKPVRIDELRRVIERLVG